VLEARRQSQLEARKMRSAKADIEDAAARAVEEATDKQKDIKSTGKQMDAKFESKLPDCNHECETCSRIHCPRRKVKS